ncbi:MAG: NAD-dependent epimerase/dehydratase family protein [Candidatus Omnitrophica bacterium]|jgi:nucleoside-diphosphate-sugar epimerase|nr:NAD-dependent epimerase/dehydratase family protein [Candidatus Omnitrophota bacterium]
MRIFITGATGFIGRSLVDELISRGHSEITALTRKTSDTEFLRNRDIKIVYGDVTDKTCLKLVEGDYDVLFHCAGLVTNRDKRMLHEVNVAGTENICRWAAERNMKKVIYVSSVSVNSGNPVDMLTEDHPYSATNPYGVSKLEAEKMAVKFRDAGLPMVIVRPCIVYGEGEPHWMPFLSRLMRLRLCVIPACGDRLLHMVSVRNLAVCLVRCFEDNRALGGVFNIADNNVLTIREVLKVISKSLHVPMPVTFPRFLKNVASRLPVIGKRIRFFDKDRVYSIRKLKETIDFSPPHDVIVELMFAALSLRAHK